MCEMESLTVDFPSGELINMYDSQGTCTYLNNCAYLNNCVNLVRDNLILYEIYINLNIEFQITYF
jgi:hypothetical protein